MNSRGTNTVYAETKDEQKKRKKQKTKQNKEEKGYVNKACLEQAWLFLYPWPSTISINSIRPIHAVMRLLGATPLPLQNNIPCITLQQHSIEAQGNQNANICFLPLLLWFENVEAFKDVDDAKDDDKVSNWVMVNVPVKSVLVILIGPQEQGKHLQNRIEKKYIS